MGHMVLCSNTYSMTKKVAWKEALMGIGLVLAILAACAYVWQTQAACGLAVWRLRTMADAYDSSLQIQRPIGISAMLAALHAHVKAGASVHEAHARIAQSVRILHSQNSLQDADIQMMVHDCATDREEREGHGETVAAELGMAYRLSTTLGCGAAKCFAAVSASYKRLCIVEDLRRNAFAMPRSTVTLLSVLPFATVALGYVLGAHPLEFLVGSRLGWVFLGMGAVAYGIGMLWMQHLLRGAGDTHLALAMQEAGD